MNDPYKTLGVSPSASDEEIKTAYRNLARKYHPDVYAGTQMEDLASEKMKEINEAYDAILNMRKNPGSNGTYSNSYGQGRQSYGNPYQQYYQQTNSQFADIRRLIMTGKIIEAEEVLDGVPSDRRDAEWHFLKGSIFYKRGWLDEAFRHFQTAVTMNPGNMEYRSAYNQMAWQRNSGTPNRGGGGQVYTNGCSGCDICSGLICADCCCECMGGDLISCC